MKKILTFSCLGLVFFLWFFFSLFASIFQAFQITPEGKTLCSFTSGQGTEPISFDFLTSYIFQLCRFQTDLNSRSRNRTIFEFHPSLIRAEKYDSEAFHLSFHFEHCFIVRKSEMSPSQHWGGKNSNESIQVINTVISLLKYKSRHGTHVEEVPFTFILDEKNSFWFLIRFLSYFQLETVGMT